MDYSIAEVRDPHESFGKDVLGLVTFEYTPGEFAAPLVFAHYSKSKERTYPVAKIVGARRVQIIGAQLRNGKNGPWIATNNVEEIPSEVLTAVAVEAMTWKVGKKQAVPA